MHVNDDPCDILYSFDGGDRSDIALLNDVFTSPRYGYEGSFGDIEKPFLLELIDRGYDITTLEFNISLLDINDALKVNLNDRLRNQLKRL